MKVGNTYEEHCHADIDDAAAMGLDGFSLNIGDPTQDYVRQTMEYMFDYARDNHPDFKLYFSLDVWAAGDAHKGPTDYASLLRDFKGHDAYYKGPNGFSMVSTFADGGLTADEWNDWKLSWANEVYFIPDFDGTLGYYQQDPGWWEYWGDVVDGLFSWECTWPVIGATNAGDMTNDTLLVNGTETHGKEYMVGLSPLQYKNAVSLIPGF